MLLDLRKLFSNPDGACTCTFSIDLSKADFPGYRLAEPCSGTLEPVWEGHRLLLRLKAETVVLAECARCLKPVRQSFSIERSILLRESDWMQSDEDLPLTADGRLDVDELVYTELVLSVPSVFVCDEECKGICPVCGKERAQGCTCEKNVTDGRSSIVKQLL